MEDEDVKEYFENLQLQKMGDEEVKKCLEKWFENAKKSLMPEFCGFRYDEGPLIQFCHTKGDDGVDYADAHTVMECPDFNLSETIHTKGDDGVDSADAHTVMECPDFNLSKTIRTKLIVAYMSFADTYKSEYSMWDYDKILRSYTFYAFKDLDILVKFVRVYMNVLDPEYEEIKFEQW